MSQSPGLPHFGWQFIIYYEGAGGPPPPNPKRRILGLFLSSHTEAFWERQFSQTNFLFNFPTSGMLLDAVQSACLSPGCVLNRQQRPWPHLWLRLSVPRKHPDSMGHPVLEVDVLGPSPRPALPRLSPQGEGSGLRTIFVNWAGGQDAWKFLSCPKSKLYIGNEAPSLNALLVKLETTC